MTAAAKQSGEIIQNGAEQIRISLNDALGESLGKHADMISRGEEEFFREIISPVLHSMREHLEEVSNLRGQMIEETKVVRELLHANGEIARLEERLNQNLRSLAEAGSFTETVNELSAVIHLLNGKLKGPGGEEAASRLASLIEKTKGRFAEPESIPLRGGCTPAPQDGDEEAETPTYSVRTPKLGIGFWGKKKSA